MATTKPKSREMILNFADYSFVDIPVKLEIGRRRLQNSCSRRTEKLIFAIIPPTQKWKSQAHPAVRTYGQIVNQLEKHLKLKGVEVPDDMEMNKVNQQNTAVDLKTTKSTCSTFEDTQTLPKLMQSSGKR